MTCIVAAKEGSTIWFGADSIAINPHTLDKEVRATPKIFYRLNRSMVLGIAGSPKVSQLIEYHFPIPDHPAELATTEYMITSFVPALEAFLEPRGGIDRSQLLLGYQGEIFTVWHDGQVGLTDSGYGAIGIGAPFALAVLSSTKGMYSARDRCRLALEASVEHNAGVSPPFCYLALEGSNDP